jgi:cyclohexanecarboxylate-CoA ligase
LVYEVQSIIDLCALGEDDVVFMPSPVTHITGFLYAFMLPAVTATAVALMDTWEPVAGVDLIERESCRFTVAATPFLHGLVEEYASRGKQSGLRSFLCGGADVPPALIRRGTEVIGGHVARVYGSSEFPTFCSGRPGDPPEVCADTDGIPIGPVECRIDNEVDGVGELLVKGPDLFLGYLDSSLNEAAFTEDGYFRTGDLASLDANGAVTIRGRQKDIILRGGENISAKEVEDLLYGHPQVKEVAVVAMPDPVMVERACAFVVPVEGASLSLRDLTEFLAEHRVAKQKYPERVEIIEQLPVTASGKIQKYLLRDQIRAKLAAEG